MHLGQSTRVSSLKLAGVISPARLTPPPGVNDSLTNAASLIGGKVIQ